MKKKKKDFDKYFSEWAIEAGEVIMKKADKENWKKDSYIGAINFMLSDICGDMENYKKKIVDTLEKWYSKETTVIDGFNDFRRDAFSSVGNFQFQVISRIQANVFLGKTGPKFYIFKADIQNSSVILHGLCRISAEIHNYLVYLGWSAHNQGGTVDVLVDLNCCRNGRPEKIKSLF